MTDNMNTARMLLPAKVSIHVDAAESWGGGPLMQNPQGEKYRNYFELWGLMCDESIEAANAWLCEQFGLNTEVGAL